MLEESYSFSKGIIVPLLLSCLCFLCGAIRLVVSITVITLISSRPSLATALLLVLIILVAAVLIIQILLELALRRSWLGADRNVHHIATAVAARLLLCIGLLLIIVEI